MELSTIVQPIIVIEHEGITHEQTVLDVAVASCVPYQAYRRSQSRLEPPDETWEAWLAGSFTKTVRRAKIKDIPKLLDLNLGFRYAKYLQGAPAFAEDDEDPWPEPSWTSIMSFPPLKYEDFPPALKKCQVQGVDFPRNEEPLRPEAPIQIMMNDNIIMSTGKAAAQAAHALMAYARTMDQVNSLAAFRVGLSFTKDYEGVRGIVEIRDAGLTEIPAHTSTAKVVLQ